MRFILTGTGRSGTKWCATALRIHGILCGHEQVFATSQLDNMVGPSTWGPFAGDASLAAVPFLSRYPDAHRVLVVRHPLVFAPSFARAGGLLTGSQPKALQAYLHRRHPWVLAAKNNLEASLRYWVVWNSIGAAHADAVVRLEDLHAEDVVYLAGREPRWRGYPLGKVNSAGPELHIEWDDIEPRLRSKVRTLADRFGY